MVTRIFRERKLVKDQPRQRSDEHGLNEDYPLATSSISWSSSGKSPVSCLEYTRASSTCTSKTPPDPSINEVVAPSFSSNLAAKLTALGL